MLLCVRFPVVPLDIPANDVHESAPKPAHRTRIGRPNLGLQPADIHFVTDIVWPIVIVQWVELWVCDVRESGAGCHSQRISHNHEGVFESSWCEILCVCVCVCMCGEWRHWIKNRRTHGKTWVPRMTHGTTQSVWPVFSDTELSKDSTK